MTCGGNLEPLKSVSLLEVLGELSIQVVVNTRRNSLCSQGHHARVVTNRRVNLWGSR